MTDHYYSKNPSNENVEMGIVKCYLRGINFEFITSSGVFSPKRIDLGTRNFIEIMNIPLNGSVLDLGCGYGPIGIVASKINPGLDVFMSDINERAVRLAEINAARNRVFNCHVLQGHLYEPFKGILFDSVLTNPPVSAGIKKTVEPIIKGSLEHLKAEGSLQLVAQWNKGGRTISKLMKQHFGNVEVLSRKSGYRILKSKKNISE